MAGNTINTRINAEPTPPSMGAAMRFITSAPLPVLYMMGTSPKKSAKPVISMGRIR